MLRLSLNNYSYTDNHCFVVSIKIGIVNDERTNNYLKLLGEIAYLAIQIPHICTVMV